MSDDEVSRQVGEFFDKHIRFSQNRNDIKALDAALPDNRTLLRSLASRCYEEGQKAMRAGHHMEGRRLDILGAATAKTRGAGELRSKERTARKLEGKCVGSLTS